MTTASVLIVEDEEKIALLLKDYLLQAEFDVHWLERGDTAAEWVRNNAPDIVLLDIMLPGADGLSVCRDVRAFSNVPIIMITAKVEEIDRILGLELGADDYVCKPFSGREVVARVKTVLRRAAISPSDAADDYRGLRIDQDRFEASFNDLPVELTPVEFRILSLLLLDPGRVYSRNALIDKMYQDGRVVSDRTVDSHVKNLRRKLVNASGDDGWIRSIYGVGYRID